ncbi:MAG TPA: AAA family ATPase [Nitrosospira sp.]|nr:AAA family ATPase [Nitrosospira sp.]
MNKQSLQDMLLLPRIPDTPDAPDAPDTPDITDHGDHAGATSNGESPIDAPIGREAIDDRIIQPMRLTRFLVTNFRSVENSGWIEIDSVTALVGVNESGKTNLLIPLWKLNPAVGGEIVPASDYPKKQFGILRQAPENFYFITAEFEAGELAEELCGKLEISSEEASLIAVKRYFNGDYSISFPRREELGEMRRSSGEGTEDVVDAVIRALPKFVYYSEFGNLDSEIYLPHVVQNLQRTDLGPREAAKSRTLRVLFKFVGLEPGEILELGRDFPRRRGRRREPTAEEIREVAMKKRERSILLQSAGGLLTDKFRNWWKQGDYKFRFEADGSHFRIWVSDDRRPEEVELESRSTGLQWFLSFYLVFLVESGGEHQNAVLLLDEPGLSLHPLAQRNLFAFFDSLAKVNKILYTTHSPFLLDAEHLGRARKVYVSPNGTTQVTSDLRSVEKDVRQAGAAYVVHSALNLNIAESIVTGCQPVVVQRVSDQYYLSAIKTLLIGANKIAPKRELLFPPAGGSKTVGVIASIISGRDEALPKVVLRDDEAGKQINAELKSDLYSDAQERVFSTDNYVLFSNSTTEDLIPAPFFAQVIDRWERNTDTAFADVLVNGRPVVDQVQAWADAQDVVLRDEWRVEVAKRVKEQALKKGISAFDAGTIARWAKLFQELIRN